MKDAYTFDLDEGGLDSAFDDQFRAYEKIFARLGLDAVPVEASSGAMGGSDSVEFMVRSSSGEDDVAYCVACGYGANVERATSRLLEPATEGRILDEPERFPTPGVRTIEALTTFEGGAPADRQIKTLVYVLDGDPVLVLLRGDHTLQPQKLQDATGAVDIRPAHPDEVRELLGADPGSLGAVGVTHVRIVADPSLEGATGMTTGANVDDFHLRGVDVARDIDVDRWVDVREVAAGEPCIRCGAPLEVFSAIEVGHIFKLGTKYSEAMGVTVLDEQGTSRVIIMGSYGIGLERNMAAVVESHHDDKGIVWPMSVAPFEIVITVLKPGDAASMEAGEALYAQLGAAGVDVIVDDRDERPGVKFNDAELVGIPIRVTIGPRGLESGVVEVTERASNTTEEMPLAGAAEALIARVEAART
jgi:prolyl-tRNA synthetase